MERPFLEVFVNLKLRESLRTMFEDVVRFVDEKTVVMTNYCDFDVEFRQRLLSICYEGNLNEKTFYKYIIVYYCENIVKFYNFLKIFYIL